MERRPGLARSITGLTFDTGALIAFERGERRIRDVIAGARGAGIAITIPAVVIAEWWRGQAGPSARIRRAFPVEHVTRELAEIAGRALALVGQDDGRPSVVDALVMASAAQRGDFVYTSDVGDLERLRLAFPSVRVFGVSG